MTTNCQTTIFQMVTFSCRRVVLLILVALVGVAQGNSQGNERELVEQLTTANLKQKLGIVDQLSEPSILQALVDAELYYLKASKKVVIAIKSDNGFLLSDPFDSNFQQQASKREVKKITINNRIRRLIRDKLSLAKLTSKLPNERLNAVIDSYDRLDANMINRLTSLLPVEQDDEVKEAIQVALTIHQLQSDELAVQLEAVKRLSDNIHPVVKNQLAEVKTDDPQLQQAIQDSLAKIEQKVGLYKLIETLFFGLSYGSVLVLVAMGLAITFGVMGVINMAHGELVMIGAYCAFVVQTLFPSWIDLSLLIALPLAFVVSALFGMLIELLIVRNLKGRMLETLLATFGVSLILQQLVRSIFSPLNQPVSTPSWMSGFFEVNSVLSITYNRIFIILFCLGVFLMMYFIMKKTRLGMEVRAVAQDKRMASAMGVKTERINLLTFGLGSGVAGMAGVALSQLTNVGPNLGQSYIIDSFMVVVFGGVGSLVGTLFSGLSIGVLTKFMEPWLGAVVAKIVILTLIILFIQKKPKGLFPSKGRAGDS